MWKMLLHMHINQNPMMMMMMIGQQQTYLKMKVFTVKAVTFDLLILEIMFLFLENTVKILKFRYTFYHFHKS